MLLGGPCFRSCFDACVSTIARTGRDDGARSAGAVDFTQVRADHTAAHKNAGQSSVLVWIRASLPRFFRNRT